MAFDVLSAAGGTVIDQGVNPLVQLHENEMVLPAYISQPLQSMIAGGPVSNDSSSGDTNVTNHFNLTANGGGGGSVDADSILSTLNAAVRSGSLQKYPAIARIDAEVNMNKAEKEPGSVDGLILGLIDVQASMALLLCQCSGLKPKKMAQVLLNVANSHQAAGGSPEYLAAAAICGRIRRQDFERSRKSAETAR